MDGRGFWDGRGLFLGSRSMEFIHCLLFWVFFFLKIFDEKRSFDLVVISEGFLVLVENEALRFLDS